MTTTESLTTLSRAPCPTLTIDLHTRCPDEPTASLLRSLALALGCHDIVPDPLSPPPSVTAIEIARMVAPGLDWTHDDPVFAIASIGKGSVSLGLATRGRRKHALVTVILGGGSYRWMDDRSYPTETAESIEHTRDSIDYRAGQYLACRPGETGNKPHMQDRVDSILALIRGIRGEK